MAWMQGTLLELLTKDAEGWPACASPVLSVSLIRFLSKSLSEQASLTQGVHQRDAVFHLHPHHGWGLAACDSDKQLLICNTNGSFSLCSLIVYAFTHPQNDLLSSSIPQSRNSSTNVLDHQKQTKTTQVTRLWLYKPSLGLPPGPSPICWLQGAPGAEGWAGRYACQFSSPY